MPRQAHGRPLTHTNPARPPKRKPAKGRGLNALEIAERENPDVLKIPKHRLGEVFGSDDDDDDAGGDGEGEDVDGRSAKRRRVEAEQDGEGSEEGGEGSEGERWHMMGEEDEDSDIDSDEAFGESDEERFADFTFRGSEDAVGGQRRGKGKRRRGGREERALGEEGEEVGEIEDDFGDEGIDLAAALDQDSADESDGEEKPATQRSHGGAASSDDEDSEGPGSDKDSGSEEDAEDMELDFSVSDVDDGDHSRLQTFVHGLSAKKTDPNAVATSTNATGAKLSAADLMQYIKDPQQRQSLKVLQNSEAKGPELYSGGIPGRLAPPLAKRQQDRLDRGAAYQQSKKELDKWVDTVKQNRRAEHISFPLPDPDGAPSSNKKFAPVTTSKPMNDLESKIQDIMRESGILSGKPDGGENEEREFEGLEEQKLPPEEVQARRVELRKARDLMFREEIRAKRIKKIKSKAYRRVHRKERNKAALERRAELSAQGLLDSDDEREKNDRRRAEERMGARHRESKWAKGAKAAGRTVWDDDARVGVADMARRDDELRRRIEGRAGGSSDESGGEDSEEYSSDDAEDDIQRRLADAADVGPVNGRSKIADMAFMKKAEAARKAANDTQLQEIRRQMHGDAVSTGDGSEADSEDFQSGRQKFGGPAAPVETPKVPRKVKRADFEERLSDEEEDVDQDDSPQSLQPATFSKATRAANAGEHFSNSEVKSKAAKASAAQRRTISQNEYQKSRENSPKEARSQRSANKSQKLDDQIADSDAEDASLGHDDAGPETFVDSIFAEPDDVAQTFQKEKNETVQEEGDQVIDNGLPGWGSWGGVGISKKKQNKNKDHFITKVKGVAPESRKDAKLDRVIINEKRVKKNGKYLATELPHPFESRQQYERSLRLPLGPEWTTKSIFQDATKPRVLVKQGVIKPMARPMV